MSANKGFKGEWIKRTKKHYTVRCVCCGRFVSHTKEFNNEVTLMCSKCDTIKTIRFKSFKNVNKTGLFIAIWNKQFANTKRHNVENFKELVYPIHAYEYYTGNIILNGEIANGQKILGSV